MRALAGCKPMLVAWECPVPRLLWVPSHIAASQKHYVSIRKIQSQKKVTIQVSVKFLYQFKGSMLTLNIGSKIKHKLNDAGY